MKKSPDPEGSRRGFAVGHRGVFDAGLFAARVFRIAAMSFLRFFFLAASSAFASANAVCSW